MSPFRERLARHRAATYCVVTFALTWAFWLLTVYPQAIPALQAGANPLGSTPVVLAVGAGMFFPAIGVIITRLITGEGFKRAWVVPREFRRTWKYYIIGWFGPTALVTAGAALFFALNPGSFDPSMPGFIETTREQALATGQDVSMSDDELRMLGLAQLPLVLVAPLLNCVPCFGEEWGWRGYLLPKLAEERSITSAVVTSGIIWGLWHAPITALGHNYGLGYLGWPVLGIAAMCVFTTVAGCFFAWLTLRARSCLPAVFAHGALNGCASAPLMFMACAANPFIGPAPTGIIGGMGFIVAGIACLIALRRYQNV